MKSKSLILSALVTLAGFLPQSKAALVPLGSAGSFAVLAGAGITVGGAVNSTTIIGDIGTYPTPPFVTGIGNVSFVTGADRTGNAGAMLDAKTDLDTAYFAASQSVDFNVPTELGGGLDKTPGVYAAGTFGITGILTLDAGNDPNAVWIFLAGTTLITASDSKVVFKDGIGSACHVFWQVGISATLGADSEFVGTILALTDITANASATVHGRLLARDGAVTLDQNTIDSTCVPIPEASSFWPLAFCASVFGAWQCLAVWRRKLGRC